VIGWMSAAWGHPLGAGFSTESLVLRVQPTHVVVHYAAEVDTALLARRSSGRAPVDDLAIELESGLQLRIDGVAVPLGPGSRSVDPDRSPHTVGVDATWQVPLPAEAHGVSLSTTNLVDTRVMRAADVWVHPGMRVQHASVLAERDGVVVRDDGLRWRQDESARMVSVEFRREASLWSLLAGRGSEPVRARVALEPRGWARWAPSAREPAVAGWWLLAAVGCRSAADAPGWHRLAGVCLGLLASNLVPATGGAEVVAAACLSLAALSPWRSRLLPAALAGMVLTTHPAPTALLAAFVMLVPVPQPAITRPAVALLTAAVFLGFRGLAGQLA
jgi:hypothetical protein